MTSGTINGIIDVVITKAWGLSPLGALVSQLFPPTGLYIPTGKEHPLYLPLVECRHSEGVEEILTLFVRSGIGLYKW